MSGVINWEVPQRVMVTGGNSMIGRAVVDTLFKRGLNHVDLVDVVPHAECDLLDIDQVRSRFQQFKPDYVIHAAGYNGGIEWNKKYPSTIFYRTVQMGLNVLEMSHRFSVSRVQSIISSCAYPNTDAEELKEEDFWNGPSNDSVDCHGHAKRFLDAFSRQISKQHEGTRATSVVLNNSYGPYDSYDPHKTKVVGAMVKRFVDAKNDNLPFVECWGSGSPLREFVYSKDAGELIVKALESYCNPWFPLNLSTGIEVSIKELAETTAKVVGYEGEIRWDTSKQDGQLRKKLNTDRMFEELYPEDKPKFTSLEEGLKKTVEWYENASRRNSTLPEA